MPLPAILAFVALTLTVSYGSYRYVELPFRGMRSSPTGSRSLALVAGALAVIWLAHFFSPRLVDPLPEALTRYARDEEICHGRVVGDCIRGNRSADHEILLLGDSHGAQLNLFADVVGQSFHTKIRVVTASSCLPIEGFDVERPVEWARAPCLDQIEKAKSYIPLAQGLILAGMWQYHFKSERFLRALDRFIDEAAKRNQRVMVLAQLPMLESNVLRQFRFEHLGLPHSRVKTHPEWRAANQRIRELVARHPLATFLDADGRSTIRKRSLRERRPSLLRQSSLERGRLTPLRRGSVGEALQLVCQRLQR